MGCLSMGTFCRMLPVLMAVLVTLFSLQVAPVAACSCIHSHPQVQFCNADWVIEAEVKTDTIQDDHSRFDGVFVVDIMTVFKGHSYFKKGGQNGSFALINTGINSAVCGVDLEIYGTYVLKGSYSNGRAYTSICDEPQKWSDIPKVVQMGYCYLYENNCQCAVEICNPLFTKVCTTGCPVSRDDWQCYWDNGVCEVGQNKDAPCTWS